MVTFVRGRPHESNLATRAARDRIDPDQHVTEAEQLAPYTLPVTRYVLNDDVSIAYQVMGDGPIDIILLPASMSHVEASLMPRTYRCARLLETLD
jgi:hypothetical protein